MDNPNVAVRKKKGFGDAVYALSDLPKGVHIAAFDGEVCSAARASDLPNNPPDYVRDHAVQFSETQYRMARGLAVKLNHSCDPNCGIVERFEIVSIRDIKQGEELCWDYETTEDSDWTMQCKCGSNNCRGLVGAYRNLPANMRKKYSDYTSAWLIEKYGRP
jgi:hypothetical protein